MNNEIPKEIRDILYEIHKNTRIRECIYPDHANCNEIAHAHSIQDSKILKKLAEDGKVIMLDRKSNFSYEFGHSEASVFTGFCKHHDQMLFRPIEYYPFTKSFEQIFLYTYRAFAYSYHKKKEELLQNINLYNHPKCIGLNKCLTSYQVLSSAISIQNFEEEKLFFDEALLSNDYNVLSGLVWTFEGESKFASVGYEAMPMDFDGNIIQDFHNPINGIRNIYITIFPENGKTYSIISWLNLSSPVYKTVYEKLNNLTEEERKNFINNTIPIYTNNCAFKPSFYKSFHKDLRVEFDAIFNHLLELERNGKPYNWFDKPKFALL